MRTNDEPATTIEDQIFGVIDAVVAAAAEMSRDDIGRHVDGVKSRFVDRQTRILVAGDYKAGKSTLVNALVNANVCPVDDDLATAAPTLVTYGDEPAARWIDTDDDGGTVRTEIGIEELRRRVFERAADTKTRAEVDRRHQTGVGEVRLQRRLLADGLSFVDSPGVGGLESCAAQALAAALHVDGVLFVTGAGQELTATELQFLQRVHHVTPVVVVMTKVDFYPAWGQILTLDRRHLASSDLDIPVFPVSSRLRTQALERSDRAMNEESRFPELVGYLSALNADHVVSAAADAGRDIAIAMQELIEPLEGERRALRSSAEAAEVIRRLEQATERHEHLRTHRSAWRQMLADEFAVLSSDVEFDLKERVRQMLRDSEEAITNFDPGEEWDKFDSWLHERVAHEVVTNHSWALERARVLLKEVEETFADEDLAVARVLDLEVDATGQSTGHGSVAASRGESDEDGVLRRGLVAARGMQGGVVLLSVLGGVLGFTVAAPVVVGLGLALGGRALRDERERQLQVRRRQAANGVRKYLDEVSFNAVKETRDLLRMLQRSLRESLTERADELSRSAKVALEAARDAAAQDRASRQEKLRIVETDLARLRSMQQQAASFADGDRR